MYEVIQLRIMLINPSVPVYLRMPSLPLGLVSIASYLKAHGHTVRFVERLVIKEDLKSAVEDFRPEIIGVSALSFLSSLDAKKITAELRKHTEVPIVWGGQAPSACPEMILREAKPDYIIIGEGELTWLELVEKLENNQDISGLEGLAYLRDGKFVCNPIRKVADLTTFPDMDWSFIEPERYLSSFFNCTRMFYLHASKGCPAACTFCSNKQFHQGCNRCRSIDQVMRDVTFLVKECGANGIYFSDELFCPRRDVRTDLCNRLIEADLDLVWGCQMRLGVLNEDDVKLMYKAGCRWILFGIESGSPERIKKVKKSIDLSLAKRNVEWCEKAGITVQASFIIGFPHESEKELRMTLDLAKSMPASLIVMNILTPMPNSEMLEEIKVDFPDYKVPDTIEKYARKIEQTATDIVPYNFSDVPTKELRVIHFYYQWKDFSGKHSVNHDSYGIIKKMARDTVNRIFMHGLKGFVFGTFVSARQFLTVYYYSHFFPGIRKKYDLKL